MRIPRRLALVITAYRQISGTTSQPRRIRNKIDKNFIAMSKKIDEVVEEYIVR
jgi:hypothetical protein